jgi:hypothetical protein
MARKCSIIGYVYAIAHYEKSEPKHEIRILHQCDVNIQV